MNDKEYLAALKQERDGLAQSPDRPAKDRRLGEIDELIGQLEDTGDRTPREKATPRRAGAKES